MKPAEEIFLQEEGGDDKFDGDLPQLFVALSCSALKYLHEKKLKKAPPSVEYMWAIHKAITHKFDKLQDLFDRVWCGPFFERLENAMIVKEDTWHIYEFPSRDLLLILCNLLWNLSRDIKESQTTTDSLKKREITYYLSQRNNAWLLVLCFVGTEAAPKNNDWILMYWSTAILCKQYL